MTKQKRLFIFQRDGFSRVRILAVLRKVVNTDWIVLGRTFSMDLEFEI